jgi:Holliday junction DNA helicase RuvA
MIAQITGVLAEKSPDQLVINVAGVGYQVFVSLQAFYRLPAIGEQVSLHIHTHTREDALQLYGFLEREEKDLFLLLRGVNGIGPRLALNILSGIPVQELKEALSDSDVARLLAIPGVGKKMAERLVVELREKVSVVRNGQTQGISGEQAQVATEAVSALVNLGYRKTEAEKSVGLALKSGKKEVAEVIREALRNLVI